MPSSFKSQYAARVASGAIEADAAQARAVEALAALEDRLAGYHPPRKTGFLGRLFADKPATPPEGLYIHGKVGRGKTMLMDLFFEASGVKHKRRAHFHEFMAEVHERVHALRQQVKSGDLAADHDVIAGVADEIFADAWLLCFDEFHVTDIADAMILGRLFAKLFERGVVIVATSNVAPDDLYKDGLNRALFLPFIATIKARMRELRLDARTDFRMEKLAGLQSWLVPADLAATTALDRAFDAIAGEPARPRDIALKGRVLHVARQANGVARFSFAELCERPLGASDYLRLARDYHTLVIDGVPAMAYDNRNAAKRFITLIDTLYDNAVKLVASAAADPLSLYSAQEGVEAMEFQRTASRLTEMGSDSYLALPHGRGDSVGSGSSTGLVETVILWVGILHAHLAPVVDTRVPTLQSACLTIHQCGA